MEASRSTWTDSRLDDLKEAVAVVDEKVTRFEQKTDQRFVRLEQKVDAGFTHLDRKIDEGLGRLDERIGGTNERIDKLNHTMIQGMVALISVIGVLLSILVGIVAVRLF
jgi:hypothetical protein